MKTSRRRFVGAGLFGGVAAARPRPSLAAPAPVEPNPRYARLDEDAIRHIVISEFLAPVLVDVACPGDVISAIETLKLKTGHSPNAEQIKAIGKALKVQAVIFGAVNKFGEVREGNISSPEVSITLMMPDTSSGSIIWSVTMTRGGADFWAKHFGARADTMSEAVLKVVKEAIQTLYKR